MSMWAEHVEGNLAVEMTLCVEVSCTNQSVCLVQKAVFAVVCCYTCVLPLRKYLVLRSSMGNRTGDGEMEDILVFLYTSQLYE